MMEGKKMKRYIENILWTIFLILATGVICFFIIGIIKAPSERQEDIFKYELFDADWYQVKDDGRKIPIVVPGKCSAKKNEVVTITAKLPNKLSLDNITTWLCFRTTKQDMKVFVNGKLREEYNTKKTRRWGKTSVSTYFFVPLYESDCGKDIKVSFVSNSNYAGVIRDIYCGTASGMILQFIKENVFDTLSAVFIFVLSVISIIISKILSIKVGKKFYLEYIGWGEIFLSLWVIAQSPIRQFYFESVSFASDITYCSLFLFSIPIAFFLNHIQKYRYIKVYYSIIVLAMMFFMSAIILQTTNIVDFSEILYACMSLQVLEAIVAIVTIIIDHIRGYIKEYILIMWGFIGLAICGIIQVIMYSKKVIIYKGNFLCIGAILLLIMTVISTLKDYVSLEKEMKESQLKTEKLTYQIMETLVHTIEAKDRYTQGHSRRVAEYARMIAQRMNLDEEQQKQVYFMGILHDIGKIGIADNIINKKGKLNDSEYAMIKSHSVIGYNILKNMSEIKDIEYGARWHHERYDGKGYPDGLAGENIPLYARIIAVSDAYDAMTSNRSYRNVLSQKKVRSEIEKGRGTQFDPEIANIMLDIIDEDSNYTMRQEKVV